MIGWAIAGAIAAALVFLQVETDDETPPDHAPQVPDGIPPVQKSAVRNWKTGEMVLVVGASQSGKTYWTASQVKRFKRLLVWDTEGQFADDGLCTRTITSIRELADFVRSNPDQFRVSYQPRDKRAEFDAFCLLALVICEAGVIGRQVETCIVVEELSDVTSPGKAPPGWGELVRKGLKRNMHLYAVTQRPSESDKTVVGNCSQIHCCGVQRHQDAKYMAAELSLPVESIAGLNRKLKQFVHRNCVTGATEWGGIKPPKGLPTETPSEITVSRDGAELTA